MGKTTSAGSQTFRREGGGVTKFAHTDRLGSTSRPTNASQTVTDTRSFDAFGMTLASSGTTPTPFGFAGDWGYQTDTESGLQLLGHRYYDPSTGRFLTRDPIKDGRNWYGYCGNNPLRWVDPQGLNLTVIGDTSGLEGWEWVAEHVFGVGGTVLRQPGKDALIQALIDEKDGAQVMIWGHGGPGYINLGDGASLTTEDVRYIAAERKRREKGKRGRVWLRVSAPAGTLPG